MFDFKRSLRPTTDSFGSGVVLSTLATHTVPSVRLGGATVQVPFRLRLECKPSFCCFGSF